MINVTCAIIRNEDNEVLTVQRGSGLSNPFKWEFPGGKIKEGESAEECLVREIGEELSMEIVICDRMADVEYDYGTKQIRLIPFICDTLDELPVLSEHEAYKWLPPEKLFSVDLSAADIHVAIMYQEIINNMNESHEAGPRDEGAPFGEEDFHDMVKGIKSTVEAEWIAASAVENPGILKKLMEYSYSDDTKLAFHSSWIISKLFDINPGLIGPYINIITDRLDKIINGSVRRSFLRILSLTDPGLVSTQYHGKLTDHCLNALNSPLSPVAVKAYSMEILYKLALIYPELANELSASISMISGKPSV